MMFPSILQAEKMTNQLYKIHFKMGKYQGIKREEHPAIKREEHPAIKMEEHLGIENYRNQR